nr:hypothetical protein [Aeromicrobium chenweiae]
MITPAWSVDRSPAAHAARVASVSVPVTRARPTSLLASPLVIPVVLASQVVVEVAPSSLARPMPSAQPARLDSAASIEVRARATARTTCLTSEPVNDHGSSAARSSVNDDSWSRIMSGLRRD